MISRYKRYIIKVPLKHSKKLIFLFLAISGGAGILTQGSPKRNNCIFQITIKIVIL